MRYAQIKRALQLHLVCEPGEIFKGEIVKPGCLSMPLCGLKVTGYRMTSNVPWGHACKNCLRVFAAKAALEEE